MNKQLLLGISGIILGLWLLLISATTIYKQTATVNIEPIIIQQDIQPNLSLLGFIPTNIRIDKVNIDVEVLPGGFDHQSQWELSPTKANFVVLSQPQPKIVIYGHNQPSIFGNLTKIKIGDLVEITDRYSGLTKQFTITESTIFDPQDIQALHPESPADLILYTCTGVLDSKRLILKANLVSNNL